MLMTSGLARTAITSRARIRHVAIVPNRATIRTPGISRPGRASRMTASSTWSPSVPASARSNSHSAGSTANSVVRRGLLELYRHILGDSVGSHADERLLTRFAYRGDYGTWARGPGGHRNDGGVLGSPGNVVSGGGNAFALLIDRGCEEGYGTAGDGRGGGGRWDGGGNLDSFVGQHDALYRTGRPAASEVTDGPDGRDEDAAAEPRVERDPFQSSLVPRVSRCQREVWEAADKSPRPVVGREVVPEGVQDLRCAGTEFGNPGVPVRHPGRLVQRAAKADQGRLRIEIHRPDIRTDGPQRRAGACGGRSARWRSGRCSSAQLCLALPRDHDLPLPCAPARVGPRILTVSFVAALSGAFSPVEGLSSAFSFVE